MMTSDKLRGWRASKRMTQDQAASALGYSRRAYQEIEGKFGEIDRTLELAVAGYDAASSVAVKSLHNTTAGDLSDIERVKDAEHEFRRATTDAALADWARRWGESWIALGHLDEMDIARADVADELREAEDDAGQARAEADEAKDELYELKTAARVVINAVSDAEAQRLETELDALQELL